MTAAGKIQPTQGKEAPLASREVKMMQAPGSPWHLTLRKIPALVGSQQPGLCGTAFQQTLSWMNRESCVLSDTKACIVLLVWASCSKDLEHFACVLLPAMPQDKAAPLLQLSIPQQSSPHRFLRVTIPLYRFKSLQHDQKCILSLPSMGN